MRKTPKSVGVATLAAATIVSGLSFGPAAAQAVEAQADTMTRPFIMKSLTEQDPAKAFVGGESRGQQLEPLRANTGMTTFSEALRASMNATFPAPGNSGQIIFENGACLTLTSYNGGWYMGSGSCAEAEEFTVHPDGTLESRHPTADLTWAGLHNRNNGLNSITRTATPIAALELALAPGALTGTVASTTTVVPGQSTSVAAEFLANREFGRPTAGTTVTFTAPAGTTFTADQTTIRGQFRPAGGTWRNFAHDNLTGGSISPDGRSASFEWAPTSSGWSMSTDNEIRFPISIDVPTGASNSDATLNAIAIGSTAEDSFKTTARTPIDVAVNGGFEPTGVGAAASARQGEQTTVIVGSRATGSIRSLIGTSVEFVAPAGTTFPAGMTELDGTYRHADGHWSSSSTFRLSGSVAADGRTFAGTLADSSTLKLEEGSEFRWDVDLAAARDAEVGTRDLGFTINGATNLGSFTVEGASPVTIEEASAAALEVTAPKSGDLVFSAEGTPGYPNARVTFTGTGQPDAAIEGFRSNGKLGGSTVVNQDGTWSMDMDMAFVTYPVTTITQTIKGEQPTKQEVTDLTIARDGAQKDFTVDDLADGGTISAPAGNSPTFPNAKLTVRGEGVAGSEIAVKRHNKAVAGKTRVLPDGTWSVDANVNWGTWDLHVEHILPDGITTTKSFSKVNIVEAGDELPFVVTAPVSNQDAAGPAGGGGAFPNARVTFTGEGKSGDRIQITRAHNGKTAGTGSVRPDGTWSIDCDFNWGTWSADVSVNGVKQASVADFTVVR